MKSADVIVTLKYSRNLSNSIHRRWAYSNCWWSNIGTILVIQNLFTWLQSSNTTKPNESIQHRTDQQDPIFCHQIVAHPHKPLKKFYTALTTQWAAPCWLNSTLYTTINATRSLDSSALMSDSMTQKKCWNQGLLKMSRVLGSVPESGAGSSTADHYTMLLWA